MALPLLMLILPLSHIIRNHPYEYVYFNEIGGGVKKAYGNYELDYYYHSTRKATEWIIKNAEKGPLTTGDKILVATWHPASVDYFLRNDTARFSLTFTRWENRGDYDWDYAVFVVTGIPPEQIKSKHFPPANTVHTINVDGKPICLILKRHDKSDYQAAQYMEQKDTANAILFLEKALAHDPYNDTALANLIEAYYIAGQLDFYPDLIDHALKFIPKNKRINWYNAYLYTMKNDYDKAIKIANQVIADDFREKDFYRLLYNCYLQKREYGLVEKTLLNMIENDVMEQVDATQLVSLYRSQGMSNVSAQYKFYRLMESHYAKKKNEKKNLEYFRKAAEEIKRNNFLPN